MSKSIRMLVVALSCLCLPSPELTWEQGGTERPREHATDTDPAPAETAARLGEKTYTLFAGGDTMLARWVHQAYYRRGGVWMFEAVSDLVKNADVALTNLECVVSSKGDFQEKGERRPFLYRARPETLDILTEAGFDVVTTGNNHSLDYGPEALLDQARLLGAVSIAHTGAGENPGAADDPAYVKVGDVILAIIGMDNTMKPFAATEGRPGIFYMKPSNKVPERLKNVIAEARKQSDLVVFSPHWGKNWTENPKRERVELARAVIDAGVDAILGHSSHQLHGVEIYRGKPIVYDMGTLFFDTIRQKRMRLSAGFVLEFTKQGFTKLAIHPFYLSSCRVDPAKGRHLERIQELVRNLTKELSPDILFEVDGDALTVSFEPQEAPPARVADPEQVLVVGSTKRLSEELRNAKSSFVVDELPEWIERFEPVELEHGITVLGHWHAEAVRPKRGFVSKVAIKVSGPLTGRWESFIEARRREDGEKMRWRHPVGDGGWQPEIWQNGDNVIDQTLFRTKLDEGVWDLFWGIEDRKTKVLAKAKQPLPPLAIEGESAPMPEGMVPVGYIHVLKEGIPKGPAGLKWSGILPDELRHLRAEE